VSFNEDLLSLHLLNGRRIIVGFFFFFQVLENGLKSAAGG
jgi:hypothetical protein